MRLRACVCVHVCVRLNAGSCDVPFFWDEGPSFPLSHILYVWVSVSCDCALHGSAIHPYYFINRPRSSLYWWHWLIFRFPDISHMKPSSSVVRDLQRICLSHSHTVVSAENTSVFISHTYPRTPSFLFAVLMLIPVKSVTPFHPREGPCRGERGPEG